jgi:rSAM/selenodomain-associated transferase 2/rSAM/selenodomain-associated transferase 1
MRVKSKKALVVFLRYPQLGRVKRRLAEGVGEEEALRIYTMLLRRNLGVVKDFLGMQRDVEAFLCHEPPEAAEELRENYPGPYSLIPQRNGDLGKRMEGAFLDLFELGYGEVVLLGSDIADLEPSDICGAFMALSKGEVPIGPSHDGGFYLLGLRRPFPAVFALGEWSTGDVLQRVLKALHGFRFVLLNKRHDVDTPSDMHLVSRGMFRDTISVIIPHLEGGLDEALSLANRIRSLMWPNDEVVLAEGTEKALLCAQEEEPLQGIRLVRSSRGRGIQLNTGACASRGDILWFLHADSDPPSDFAYLLRKLYRGSHCSFGCFRLGFRDEAPIMRLVSMWANARTALLKIPYGDQGIFCRRDIFARVGGFGKRLIMEDVDLARSLKKLGKLLFLRERLLTSPNRYLKGGVLRTALRNQLTMSMYLRGIPEERIYRYYYGAG